MPEREHTARRAAQKAAARAVEAAAQLELALVRFKDEGTDIDFSVDLTQETVWATQQQIADLYGVGVPAISKHIANIYGEGELAQRATLSKLEIVQTEGGREVRRKVDHYNLDMILSVGYRVSSAKATKFRQWATATLRSYIVDGFALNEARLRDDPTALKKLAAKIRALRADEKNIYASVRECFKISAADYDKDAPETRKFFAFLQDKFLYAITERTASQIVLTRANHKERNMGLQAMKGAEPKLTDATIGKNYLDANELYTLHILCEQFLLFAESKALRGQRLTMRQLATKLNALLETNEYPVFREYKDFLRDKAVQHAQAEFAMYKRRIARKADPKALPKT